MTFELCPRAYVLGALQVLVKFVREDDGVVFRFLLLALEDGKSLEDEAFVWMEVKTENGGIAVLAKPSPRRRTVP